MTNIPRRLALGLLAAPALGPALVPRLARGQSGEWPRRTVRYINPYPPGGPTDTLSRL
jgi:tripartite-type tricarboxylate transporter receptor subunit TctC